LRTPHGEETTRRSKVESIGQKGHLNYLKRFGLSPLADESLTGRNEAAARADAGSTSSFFAIRIIRDR
jgi:hypothetical protein